MRRARARRGDPARSPAGEPRGDLADARVRVGRSPGGAPGAPEEKRVTAESMSMTTVTVCVTCRAEGEPALPMEARAGRRFHDALAGALDGTADVRLVPVECLSVCKRPCTLAISAPGKWTYVYGDFPADAGVGVLVDALRLYAEAPDGLIPWKLRPEALKKGVIARLPPAPHTSEGEAA